MVPVMQHHIFAKAHQHDHISVFNLPKGKEPGDAIYFAFKAKTPLGLLLQR